MYLVYLGESGNTGNSLNDPNQPHLVHVGLLVHESKALSINAEFNALHRRYFGRPPGEPGGPKGLRPADIYQGIGAFSSWLPLKRNELIQDCLSILVRRQIPAIIAYVNKQEFDQVRTSDSNPNTVWASPTEPIISRFLTALNLYMDELNLAGMDHQQMMTSEWPVNDFALVVAGDTRSVEPRFMTQFLKSDDGIDSSAVLDNFCFVGMEHSVGTQLANMCAYFTRRWLQNPSALHPYFDALKNSNVVQVIYPVQF
jgi:hypothetical protein